MTNLAALHPEGPEVSAKKLFRGELGTATAIQLQEKGILQEHKTTTPAMLICVIGKVIYQDENQMFTELDPGEFISIAPNVKHWIEARESSQLVLLR